MSRYTVTIICMNVDIFAAQAASNTNIFTQVNVPPVVTLVQASQYKSAFVGGLQRVFKNHRDKSKRRLLYLRLARLSNSKNLHQKKTFDIQLHSAGGAAELPSGFIETKKIDHRENMQTVQKKTHQNKARCGWQEKKLLFKRFDQQHMSRKRHHHR